MSDYIIIVLLVINLFLILKLYTDVEGMENKKTNPILHRALQNQVFENPNPLSIINTRFDIGSQYDSNLQETKL